MSLFNKNIDFSNTDAEQFFIESQKNIHQISLEEKRDEIVKEIDELFSREESNEIYYFIRYYFGYQLDKNIVTSTARLWDIKDNRVIKETSIDSNILFTIVAGDNWKDKMTKKINYDYEYFVNISTQILPKLPLYGNLISDVEQNISEFFSSLDYKLINIKTQYVEEHSGNSSNNSFSSGKPYSMIFSEFLIKLQK